MMEQNNKTDSNRSTKGYAVRPESGRPKMPLSQRAKQFAPFDSLTGLGERLKAAEEEHRREREAGGVIHVDIGENDYE